MPRLVLWLNQTTYSTTTRSYHRVHVYGLFRSFLHLLYQISSIPTTLHHYQTPGRISGPFDTFRSSFKRSTLLLHVHRLSYKFSEFFTTRFRPFSTIFDHFDP